MGKFTQKHGIILLICLGVFFRFYNIGYQVYWYDETQTSLRISGNTAEEFVREVYTGKPTSVGQILETYQYPNPEKNLEDVLYALSGNPEHSPLYYLMARIWLQIFGHSVTTIRLLSALIGLLVFPCVYWLGWELFRDRTAAWASVAIMAISPFHVLYAKEAREYSLWTVAILLSSAALLWALRVSRAEKGIRKQWLVWSFYGITVAFGLYAHPFSALVSLGHGLYVILVEKWQGRKQIFAGFLSTLMGIALFLPWLNIVLANFSDFVENTISTSTPRPQLYLIWGLNVSRIFFDVNQGTSPLNPTLYLFIGLVGYSIYVLCREVPPRVWVFLITLMGVTGLALMVPDVLAGGRRSSILRYAVPCVLGIQLTVSYMLASKLTAATDRELRKWKRIAIALVFGGILSCLVSAHVPVWWHKSPAKSRFNPAIADIINAGDRPLVISDEIQGRVLAFLHLLRQDVVVQLVVPPQLPQIPQGFNPIFLYRLSDPAKAALAQATNARLEEAYDRGWLWQLVPNNTSSSEENS